MKPPGLRSDHDALIEVRNSAVHGLGAFARRALRKGQLIGCYEGRRLSEAPDVSELDGGLTYLFVLSDGSLIDGGVGGNATRCLNHSCAPNCEAVERLRADGQLDVRILALRAIAAGEELFLDYSLVIDASESPADYPCRCGAATCRGTLAAA